MEGFFSNVDYVCKVNFSFFFFLVKVNFGGCFTVEILKGKNTHVGSSLVA